MLHVIEALLAGSTLMLAFLIFTNPRGVNKRANFWLGIFMLCLAMVFLDGLFINHRIYHSFPHLIGISELAFFLFAPAIYFATLHFVSPQRAYKWTDLWHFFFFIVYLFVNVPSLFFMTGAAKLKMLTEEHPMETGDYIAMGVLLANMLVYCGLSLIKLNRHQRNIELIHASGAEFSLNWFKYFLIGVFVSVLIWITFVLVQDPYFNLIVALIHVVIVFFLAYYALHQGEVYNFNLSEKQEIQELIAETEDAHASKKPQLGPERLQAYKEQLKEVMHLQKPFLDNELNLLKLAELMQTTIHTLSYVINEGYGENFALFVNRFRVEEAKKLLEDPAVAHLSMLGIAFEAGFNSKTAFNTAFKKISGFSPSEYKTRSTVL
jgi:AraC-like DNA-binding protein